jgi:hypothetical protein
MIVEIGRSQIKSRFLVIEGLAADFILGRPFTSKHVTAILPKEKQVRLSDASVIPILRDSDLRYRWEARAHVRVVQI